MKVVYSISSSLGGKGIGGIAYHGAEVFYRNGELQKAIALSYSKKSIPSNLVNTNPVLNFLNQALGFIRARLFPQIPQYQVIDNLFDSWAKPKVKDAQIFHGWKNHCLKQLRRAKRQGMISVVECASTHPEHQLEIVKKEYQKWKTPLELPSKKYLDKGLQEMEIADFIKVPSKFVEKTLLERGIPKKKIITIPFGVDANRFSPRQNKGRFTAIFVGSVGLRKGIPYLLKAWDEAKIDGKLIVAGQVLKEVEHIVRKYEGREDIIFTRSYVDAATEFKKADLFVFPSLEEGSALVTYEAMASGLPSLVTAETGSLIRDKKDGFVVPARDAKVLANKLRWCFQNRKKIQVLGASAREHIKPYTWERHGDSYRKELFRRIT